MECLKKTQQEYRIKVMRVQVRSGKGAGLCPCTIEKGGRPWGQVPDPPFTGRCNCTLPASRLRALK